MNTEKPKLVKVPDQLAPPVVYLPAPPLRIERYPATDWSANTQLVRFAA